MHTEEWREFWIVGDLKYQCSCRTLDWVLLSLQNYSAFFLPKEKTAFYVLIHTVMQCTFTSNKTIIIKKIQNNTCVLLILPPSNLRLKSTCRGRLEIHRPIQREWWVYRRVLFVEHHPKPPRHYSERCFLGGCWCCLL